MHASRYSDYATGWMTQESGFDPLVGENNFPLLHKSRLTLGPTQPPI
jgi:hypothetical protein